MVPVLAMACLTCTPRNQPSFDLVDPHDRPDEIPADQIRHYAIWFGGARIGTAVETETWTRAGVHLRRDEQLRFLRGDAPVAIATTIDITADRSLAPLRVSWTERAATIRHAEAVHEPTGWIVTTQDARVAIAGDAIPAELAPLIIRRDGKFAGTVFLPGRSFMTGIGRIDPIDPVAPSRLIARVDLRDGPSLEATYDLDRDGTPARVVDGEGVIELRTTRAIAELAFPLVDLVAAASIPITGVASSTHQPDAGFGPGSDSSRGTSGPDGAGSLGSDGTSGSAGSVGSAGSRSSAGSSRSTKSSGSAGAAGSADGQRSIWLDDPGPFPGLPGQAVVGDRIAMSRRLPGDLPAGPAGADRTREIAALVGDLRSRLAPDLSLAHGGDCTTFALAYHALATHAAIPTRVVTGLRVDGDRLVRHRWAVSWTGRAWIAVDAAFGEAPAGGDLVGLAVHGADDAGLVAGEAALAHVHAASW